MDWRRTGVRLAARLATAALLVSGPATAGCVPSAGVDAPSATHSSAPVGRLMSDQAQRHAADVLARRDQAIRTQDRARFLADVDPAARESEARMFAGIAALDFDEYGVRLQGGLTPRDGADTRYWEGVAAVRTRLAKADSSAAVSTRPVRFREAAGRLWLLPPAPPATGADPWEVGLETVVAGRRSLVIGPAEQVSRLGVVAKSTDAAVEAVSQRWGSAWSRYAVVVVPRDLDDMARLLDGHPETLAQTAAVTTTVGEQPTGDRPTRVVTNPLLLQQLSEPALAVLLRHEVTHVAAGVEVAGLPRWLSEGIAEYVAMTPGLGHSRDRSPMPSDAAFDGPPAAQAAAYAAAQAAVRRLVDRLGQRTTMALYRRAALADEDALGRLTLRLP